ncbi:MULTISPECIES: nitrilase-related carbon-nitrogen hydrolase [Chryseobacterium]|jgi:predicted amidohydrolase|uniref:Amidohydrolase n=1 Tax=Chryseobacterium geocarposphaerae TaxID=1416776 RepID=A0ABU1LHZ1_9FLAO|nr:MULTISPECIES: nitrilase-related carbon-nitrogen hydrolase [Chryseobacterium]MDR6406351.1 putative amidohydrolase [Chryseobacterium geocarposphaerae]MDR6699210.1 putative amidohydrolase [Chryseobacterium ginsenosidimutans]
MKITGLNLDIIWKNKTGNFQLIEKELQNQNADIFLLPEMFSTGFCMDASEVADRNQESLEFLKKMSVEKNAAFCGSASVEEDGKFYNRMYFVQPDSHVDFYDKRHLFSFSGEDKVYTPGRERTIVNYKGFRILLQVCYDLRFPVFARNNDDYDAILYVANWPEKRVGAWEHLLKARAIENLSFVFGLNRIGTDGNNLFYQESSHCFFADGTEISQKSGNIVSAELNLDELKDFRNHFQFLNDRDSFSIQL